MQWIAGVLGAFGGGKFIWDILTARSQIRKNDTDRAVTLVNSAASYADGLVKRIDTISDNFDKFRQEQYKRNDEQERRDRQRDLLAMEHSRWDHRMVAQLRAKGVQVDEPPPLFLTEEVRP